MMHLCSSVSSHRIVGSSCGSSVDVLSMFFPGITPCLGGSLHMTRVHVWVRLPRSSGFCLLTVRRYLGAPAEEVPKLCPVMSLVDSVLRDTSDAGLGRARFHTVSCVNGVQLPNSIANRSKHYGGCRVDQTTMLSKARQYASRTRRVKRSNSSQIAS